MGRWAAPGRSAPWDFLRIRCLRQAWPEIRAAWPVITSQPPYEPKGDQPTAIETLTRGVEAGERFQTLLGATGTGKTF